MLLLGLLLFLIEEGQGLGIRQKGCKLPLKMLCFFGVFVNVVLDGEAI